MNPGTFQLLESDKIALLKQAVGMVFLQDPVPVNRSSFSTNVIHYIYREYIEWYLMPGNAPQGDCLFLEFIRYGVVDVDTRPDYRIDPSAGVDILLKDSRNLTGAMDDIVGPFESEPLSGHIMIDDL